MADNRGRSVADIEADIAAARERLAGNIAELVDHVSPKAVARRSIADAQTFVGQQTARVRSQLVDAGGNLRVSRLAVIGAAVGGVVTFVLVLRKIVRH